MAIKQAKKRNKKYNPNKSDDFIHPMEHMSGALAQFRKEITILLQNNKITVGYLVDEFTLLHRWCYLTVLPNYNEFGALHIRDMIEKIYLKYDDLTKETLALRRNEIVKIIKPHRELLILLIEHCFNMIISIKSRLEYAKVTREFLSLSSIRINTEAKHMQKFINVDSVDGAMKDCRKRIYKNEIIRNKKQNKVVYFDDTGDICYRSVV